MKNKEMNDNMKKKNERASVKWADIGNFRLCHESNSLGRVLCVRSVSGQWSIRWSEDTYVYAVLTRLMGDEKCHQYINALLTLYYTATNYPHDLAALAELQKTPFIDGFARLLNEQTDLEVGFHEKVSKEDDDKILQEVGEMQEIQEELERLEEEHG